MITKCFKAFQSISLKNKKFLIPPSIIKSNWRTFLSSTYSQNDKWASRLNNPIFNVSSASELGTSIIYNLDDLKNISITDYDIYVNKIGELTATDLDFVETILKKYNKTQGVLKRFDAISHAVIRSYIDFNEEHRLVDILKNRKLFGVFLDEISTNLLMNSFVIREDWSGAVTVAYERMLQEEMERPITLLLMMEICRNYWSLKKSSGFEESVEKFDEDDVEYVVVKYVPNPSYDDHFDVKRDRLLLGKTFLHIARNLEQIDVLRGSNSHLIINYNLLGLALFEKYEKLVNYLRGVLDSSKSAVICSDIIKDIDQLFDWTEPLPDGETVKRGEMYRYSSGELEGLKNSCQTVLEEFKSNNLVLNEDLSSLTEKFIKENKSSVFPDEEAYVAQVYDQWIMDRASRIEEENAKIYKEETVLNVKSKLRELLDREELAHYHEKADEIMYAAWLAPRTFREKRRGRNQVWAENIRNVESQKKRRGSILDTPEEN